MLCGRGRKAENEGCSEDIETIWRRQSYNLANGAATRALFKAKHDDRGRNFLRIRRKRVNEGNSVENSQASSE